MPDHIEFGKFFVPHVSLPRKLQEFYAKELKLGYAVPPIQIEHNVLEILDLSSNSLYCMEGPFGGLHDLEEIDLSHNYCIALSPYFFSDMPALRKLHMSYNGVGLSLEQDRQGHTFSNLTRLEYLDLSYNDIHSLSDRIFANNNLLRTVKLRNNALPVFEVSINHLSGLAFLDLSKNDLSFLSHRNMKDIDRILETSPDLFVDLGENPLDCDCSSLGFLFWYQSKYAVFSRHEQYRCTYVVNGSSVFMDDVEHFYWTLWRYCHSLDLFHITALLFFVMLIVWISCAIIYHYRYWLYFYLYISKARYFCNLDNPEHFGIKDVFLVFDDEVGHTDV